MAVKTAPHPKSRRSQKKLIRKERPPREPVDIYAHDAYVYEVRDTPNRAHRRFFKGKIARVIHAAREPNPKYSLAMSLAHLFFPNNFPEQFASGINRRITYSKRSKISPGSQRAIDGYYNGGGERYYREHERKAPYLASFDREKIEEAGIEVNTEPMNIGLKSDRVAKHGMRPIFFEVSGVNLMAALKHAVKLENSLKRTQALGLIEGLLDLIPEKEWTKYHRSVHHDLTEELKHGTRPKTRNPNKK